MKYSLILLYFHKFSRKVVYQTSYLYTYIQKKKKLSGLRWIAVHLRQAFKIVNLSIFYNLKTSNDVLKFLLVSLSFF